MITDNFKEGIVDMVDSLTSADLLNISEAVFKKTQEVSDITKSHTVVTGIRDGHKVPIIDGQPNYESFPFGDVQSCGTNECDINTQYSTRTWELGLLECRFAICLRTFDEDFLLFWNQFRVINPDIKDMNSAYMAYITKRIKENLLAAQWRTIYFGDKTSSSKLFNGFNGFYALSELNGGIKLDITENSATTLANQRMTGERVLKVLQEMYDEANETDWFDATNAIFKVTKFMAQQLAKYLNDLKDKVPVCCDIINPDAVQGSRSFNIYNISVYGIPIQVHKELDEVIAKTSELNGGSSTTPRVDPNRALLTTKSNLVIGTSESKNLNHFDVFYDKKDKNIYIDANSYIGASMPTDEYVKAF